MKLIDKDALVTEIERLKNTSLEYGYNTMQKVLANSGKDISLRQLQNFIDTLKVIDPYEQLIQYSSREDGIKAHAEDYSWNIESELFQQLTPEQQKLWRKEIEQACISGGYCGLNLQKDRRYDDNLEVKEVDLEKELSYEDYMGFFNEHPDFPDDWGFDEAWIFAKHFFELGMSVSNKAQKGE